ncbi:Acyltransferase protein [Neofusicoccum parvum]|uniref:Acyltransferase protein n=1 Tax=Neofusicoccum parvum TaxID=310453 RepID=A0ACB5S8L7_9PEZI|nr:Acyltransferase protein [Neofusicoccum parvum]
MALQKLRRLPAPAFPRALLRPAPKPLSPTAWIDGLRGLAALIVTVDHLFWSELTPIFPGYLSRPAPQNTSLLQLPPLRLLSAAHAMVPLFFVLSGLCIALGPIRARRAKTLLPALSSAAFRRPLRLFLPVLAVALASQLLHALGAYSAWPWLDDADALPTGPSPAAHARYLAAYVGTLVDAAATGAHCGGQGSADCPVGLNAQLWTLPLELRGSYVVYAAVLALAGARRGGRRVGVLGALAALLLYRGWWEGATFLAGLLVAEVEEWRGAAVAAAGLPVAVEKGRRRGGCGGVGVAALAAVGVYLVCLPGGSEESGFGPCYDFLFAWLTPRRWLVVGGLDTAIWCWRALGGAAFVGALSGGGSVSLLLRRPFVSGAAQYFGRISFMLYLVHQMVIRTLLLRVRPVLAGMLGVEQSGGLAVYMAGTVVLVISFWVAEVLVEVLDKKSVALAKRLWEKWSAAA